VRFSNGSGWREALAWAGASSFVFGSLAVAQSTTDWADVEGRIQYAYYTNDARALESVLVSLRPKPVEGENADAAADAGSRHYFNALAHYRIAQVVAAKDRSRARGAINACGDETDAVVKALPKVPVGLDDSPEARRQRAESYTLATACTLAGREMSSLPLLGGRIGSRIDEAVRLEPKNPRVRLVEALAAYERAGKDAAAKAAAVEKLRAVTQMFEAARSGPSTTPEWGAADAYAFLGRVLLEQRDVVGAREALERALLIAPDYAMARQLMSQITR
jgi:tetratricopeptide (TPR) repeat protein